MSESNDYAKAIFEHIDDCFTEEIGPVASILCEEALVAWNEELQAKGMQRNLKSIPIYIEKLAINITDEDDKERFLSAAYGIDALLFLKK